MKKYAKLLMKNYVILNFFTYLYMHFQSCAICKIADFFFNVID